MLATITFNVRESQFNASVEVGGEYLDVPRKVLSIVIGPEWSSGWWNKKSVHRGEPGTHEPGETLVVGRVKHDLNSGQIEQLRQASQEDAQWRKENDPYKKTGVFAVVGGQS